MYMEWCSPRDWINSIEWLIILIWCDIFIYGDAIFFLVQHPEKNYLICLWPCLTNISTVRKSVVYSWSNLVNFVQNVARKFIKLYLFIEFFELLSHETVPNNFSKIYIDFELLFHENIYCYIMSYFVQHSCNI